MINWSSSYHPVVVNRPELLLPVLFVSIKIPATCNVEIYLSKEKFHQAQICQWVGTSSGYWLVEGRAGQPLKRGFLDKKCKYFASPE